MAPVSGPLVMTEYRPPVDAIVPVNGPVAKIILFSGDSGSTFGETSAVKYFVARPRWPRYSFAHSMLSGSAVQVPLVRLTLSILRAQDIVTLLLRVADGDGC